MAKRTKFQKRALATSMDSKALKCYLEGLITLSDYNTIKKIRNKAITKLK